MIVLPTSRIPNASQITTVDTTVPLSITPQVGQVQSSHRSNSPQNEGSHRGIKDCRGKLPKTARLTIN